MTDKKLVEGMVEGVYRPDLEKLFQRANTELGKLAEQSLTAEAVVHSANSIMEEFIFNILMLAAIMSPTDGPVNPELFYDLVDVTVAALNHSETSEINPTPEFKTH